MSITEIPLDPDGESDPDLLERVFLAFCTRWTKTNLLAPIQARGLVVRSAW
jgi:hypothetical protein